MMKKLLFMLTTLCYAATLGAQTASLPTPQPLYPGGALTSNGLSSEKVEVTPDRMIGTTEADYLLFQAPQPTATGQAVVVCPGGGYAFTAYAHEGIAVAQWLNARGITALVLRYRMPNGHASIPLSDAQATLRLVRKNASAWHVDPHQVGIMGFSAGGHLASSASTLFNDSTDRPDFSILIYPVVSLRRPITHVGSRDNLLGADTTQRMIDRYSAEKQITDHTSTAFIALSDDDPAVSPLNSIGYYTALKQHGIPCELHIYPHGGHGWGWRTEFAYHT
ncbi:MAG: alpha/beta hydrolase, partial [Alistipes sp.]|nr:alpha/beta hydrolase [Alistipes sp.]